MDMSYAQSEIANSARAEAQAMQPDPGTTLLAIQLSRPKEQV